MTDDVADAACEAAVAFLAADPDRINKAIRTHRKAKDGLCTAHHELWPCFTRRLAERAKKRFKEVK